MTNDYAVIGNPIQHSLSPKLHQIFAKQVGLGLNYETILLNDASFEHQVQTFFERGGKGLNTTSPGKQRAFAMCDEATARCQEAGAANTLWMESGKLYADNTDGIGFLRDISRYRDLRGQSILILGAGGAVCGLMEPLFSAKPANITVANRTMVKVNRLQRRWPQISYCGFEHLQNTYDVIIHAISGSASQEYFQPLKRVMASKPFCYDLTYQADDLPKFVGLAHEQGCQAVDGFGMLVEQAAEAFFIWHGIRPKISWPFEVNGFQSKYARLSE